MVWCHIYHQSYLRLWGYEITRVNIDHDQGADCRPYQLMVLKSLLRVAYKWSSLHVILSKGPIKTALGLPVHAKLLPNILSYAQENNPKNGYAFHLWHISPPLLLLNFPFSWQSKNNVQNCFRQKMLLWDLWFSLLVEVVAMKFTSKIAPSCWSSLHYYAMHFLGQP